MRCMGKIIRLQLDRIVGRLQQNHGAVLRYTQEVVDLIAARCTEPESGGRMIEAILTNTVLPGVSRELLARLSTDRVTRSIELGVTDGELHVCFRRRGQVRRLRGAFHLAPVLCAVASVAAAPAEPDSGDVAKRFVSTLLEKAPRPSRSQGCLSEKPGPATVGRELSMILGHYIEAGWAFSIVAGCEKGLCRVAFNHRDDENEASVGFLFKGNPADGAIDTRTLECFQTH